MSSPDSREIVPDDKERKHKSHKHKSHKSHKSHKHRSSREAKEVGAAKPQEEPEEGELPDEGGQPNAIVASRNGADPSLNAGSRGALEEGAGGSDAR